MAQQKKSSKNSKTVRTPVKKKSPPKNRRFKFIFDHLAAVAVVLLVAVGGTYYLIKSNADSSDSCTVSSELVNSCRPWLGANVYGYPQAAGDLISQAKYQSNQIGHQYDIIHSYHPVGNNQLSSTEASIVNTPGQMLFTDWNPTSSWGNIASQNAGIDQMAASIKALGSHKIFMTIHHEPENDVVANGDPNCPNVGYKGSYGTVAQYRNMWAYVENRFAQDGVNNVVWSLDLMNYSAWNCLIPDLYPGDSLVDWIWFNAYDNYAGANWTSNVDNMYNLLTNGSGAVGSGHDYLSKPWGIVEWSVGHGTEAQQIAYINEAKVSLDSNQFPKLKAYMVWDSNQTGFNDRVGYDSLDNSQPDAAKEAAYLNFAKDPRFADSYYQSTGGGGGTGGGGTGGGTTSPPAKDTTPPTVSLTAPATGTTVAGTITVSGTATDNVGVTAVTMRIDNAYVATDSSAPYNFSLDTTALSAGQHTIVLRAWDAANNYAQSNATTITVLPAVSTGNGGGGLTITTGTQNGQPVTVIAFSGSPTNNTITVKGILSFTPSAGSVAGTTVSVAVDGKSVTGTNVNTDDLTNGTHTVTVTQAGQTMSQKIAVDNSWPRATINSIKAHPAAYTASTSISIVALVFVGWYARKFFGQAVSGFKTRNYVTFGGKKR